MLERPDLANDPVLRERDGRITRRDELFATIQAEFIRQPWAHWRDKMRAAQIPAGRFAPWARRCALPGAGAQVGDPHRSPHPGPDTEHRFADPLSAHAHGGPGARARGRRAHRRGFARRTGPEPGGRARVGGCRRVRGPCAGGCGGRAERHRADRQLTRSTRFGSRPPRGSSVGVQRLPPG
ncbi:MAG: CoA transferase [Burkholderiaceae bacterium]